MYGPGRFELYREHVLIELNGVEISKKELFLRDSLLGEGYRM